LYGWDFYFSVCNDAGSHLAGGTASAATLVGVSGLTGDGTPVAIVALLSLEQRQRSK